MQETKERKEELIMEINRLASGASVEALKAAQEILVVSMCNDVEQGNVSEVCQKDRL